MRSLAIPALLLLASGGAPSAADQQPSAELVQLLRDTGICPPRGECRATAAELSKLTALAKQTEQWKPSPPQVTPGAAPGAPPADAIILFDGRTLDEWVSTKDGSPARWPVRDGVLTVDKSLGNIETKRRFGSYQLHIEWRISEEVSGGDQLRGNGGLFLASTGPDNAGYEIQILDSWNNATYVNGQAASIYKQAAPLANASRPPGEWQSYDVTWTAPSFRRDGSLDSPAYVTLFHNGVLVQDHVRLAGETVYAGKPFYRAYERAPVKLQAHADPSAPISFRNIWLRELGGRAADRE